MGDRRKMGRLAEESFRNALRLHRDSIHLFERESYPSAYHLSILAQEEIGKAFVFEEVAFRYSMSEMDEEEAARFLKATLLDHRAKQRWFVRQADEWTTRKGAAALSDFAMEVYDGRLEQRKQSAVYVGLPVRRRKVDLKGRITRPSKIKMDQTQRHITRVNDYVIELVESCRRELSTVDTPELDAVLTLDLVTALEQMWPTSTPASQARRQKIRRFPLDEDEKEGLDGP